MIRQNQSQDSNDEVVYGIHCIDPEARVHHNAISFHAEFAYGTPDCAGSHR